MDVFKKIYDCIVIGDNLGGIVLATLLEKRGANVLLLMNKEDARVFKYKDYELNSDSTFIAGIERGEFFKKIVCEINYDSIHEFNDTNPIYQLITPEIRLNLFTDLKMQRAEFRREYSTSLDEIFKTQTIANEVTKIVCLFLDAHSDILFSRNIFKVKYREHTLKKLLVDFKDAVYKEPSHNGIINEIFTPQASAFSYRADTFANNLSFFCNVSSNYKKASERFLTLRGLKEFFLDHFKNFRGNIEDIKELDGFSFKGSNIQGISLNKGAKEYFCRYMVFNGSFPSIIAKLNGGFRMHGLKKILANTLHKNMYFRVHYIVDKTVIPVGLHSRAIILGDDAKRPIQMSITHDSKDLAKAIITASIEMPLEKKPSDDEYKELLSYIRKSLESIIPFFEDYVIDEFPNEKSFDNDERELFEKYLSYLANSDYNFTIAHKKNTIGLLQGRSVSTPFHNVFIQGRSILPAFGATGEIIAAHTIADFLTNKVRFY